MKNKEDALSSVVGEMLLLATAIILVAVFASSLFTVLPGDRVDTADISAYADVLGDTISFWHKGGDIIGSERLTLSVFNGTEKRAVTFESLKDQNNNDTSVFALGNCLKYTVAGLESGDQISLATDTAVIYSGVVQ